MRGSRVSEVSLIGCLSRKHFFGFFGLRGVWTQPLAPLAPEEDAALPFTVPPTFFLPIKPRPARLFPNLEASSALSLSGCHCSLHCYSLKCSFVSSSFHMCECVWKPGPSWKRAHRSQQSIEALGWESYCWPSYSCPFPNRTNDASQSPFDPSWTSTSLRKRQPGTLIITPELSPSVLNEELDSLFVHVWRWLSHAAMQEACFQFGTTRAYFIVP